MNDSEDWRRPRATAADVLYADPRRIPHRHGPIGFPNIVGYMSVDGERRYRADLSELKFISSLPRHGTKLDLERGSESAVKRTTPVNGEKLSQLLQFLTDPNIPFTKRDRPKKISLEEAEFICFRTSLIVAMSAPYQGRDAWRMVATLFRGEVFLCFLQPEEEVKRRECRSDREKQMCAWGYKFEQYLLSDFPDGKPNTDAPVIENAEYSNIYRRTFNRHRVLFGAQIDGLWAVDCKVEPKPIETAEPEQILDYLKRCQFAELKTNRRIDSNKQDYKFKRNKLLLCWCQIYLAGMNHLVVGFRDDDGVVESVEAVDLKYITDYCRGVWDPDVCLAFLEAFLSFVKSCLSKEIIKTHGELAVQNVRDLPPITLHFEYNTDSKSVQVTDNYDPDKDVILPQWFMDQYGKD